MMASDETTKVNTNHPNITDMCYDCLELIFKNLSISDLLSVAQSNQYLKQTAERHFSIHFRMKTVSLYTMFTYPQRMHQITADEIWIQDIKTSLELLRCFGHLIRKIELIYFHASIIIDQNIRRKFLRLMNYINNYCTDSLKEIRVQGDATFALQQFNKPFPNVEKVLINKNGLQPSKRLKARFPKCQKFDEVSISETHLCKQFFD